MSCARICGASAPARLSTLARSEAIDSAPPARVSNRERQTLNMIIAGKTNTEMAELMGIGPRTAEKHRESSMAKLGVKSAVELMSKALQEGLIEEHRLL